MELVVYNMRARTAGARTILILRYTDILNVARFARSACNAPQRGRRPHSGVGRHGIADGLCGSPSSCVHVCVVVR